MEGDRPLCSRGIALSYGLSGEVNTILYLEKECKIRAAGIDLNRRRMVIKIKTHIT